MKINSIVIASLIAVIVLILAFGSWGTVEAGHRGVVRRMGAVTGEIKPEGFYTKTPFVETVTEMDVRIRKEEVETEGASKDLQTVTARIALNMSLLPDKVANVFQQVGISYADTIVDPALKESTKAVLAQYTAEELISKREAVREAIRTLLQEKLIPVGLRIETVNIVNFQFSHSFNQAIEAKVTAEQNALAAKNKLSQVEFEAKQKIAEAQGKAQAMAVESAAMQNSPQILQLRALERWDGKLPTYYSGSSLPFIQMPTK